MMHPIVESKRDERVLAWLVEQVGEEAIAAACRRLAGARRPYPSNIAKALAVVPPKDLAKASPLDAKRHLDAIAAILGVQRCT